MKRNVNHWWAVLLDAETQAEIESSRGDGTAALRNHRIAALVRRKLRDDYGLNLDSICEKARKEYLRLYLDEEQRDKEETLKEQQLDGLLASIELELKPK